MTSVLILGGGGMIGQKLAAHLASVGLNGTSCDVTLFDMAFPELSAEGSQIKGNVTDPGIMPQLVASRPDVIFHLASVVSGEAEQDYDKGWAVNMQPMWALLEAIRAEPDYYPKMVFSSSIAVFGAPYPDAIDDTFLSAPLSSYGAQKATCELMLSDASRKCFVDGVSIRLPTICVRPGKPNAAASGFFSGIIREPLNGQKAILPVSDSVRHWHASPKSAVGFLIHAATMDTKQLNGRRALNMPGFSCTVAEQIEALRRVAGQSAVDLITPESDPDIIAIVKNWPRNFDTKRAIDLGFKAEKNFDEIIQVYIDEELGGRV